MEVNRNDWIELFRVVAACGVIWFHLDTTPGKSVGLAGLVFFLLIGVIFQRRSVNHGSGGDYFRKRATRLLVPWAAWFVIYGLLNLVRGKTLFPYSSGIVADLLTGPWIGLWYLPFSFASACVVYGAVKLLRRVPLNIQVVSYFLVSILSLVLVSRVRTSTLLLAPWAQFLQAAPSVPIGFAFIAALEFLPKSFWMLLVLQGVLLMTCGYVHGTDPGLAVSYGLGTLLVSAGFAFEHRLTLPVGVGSSLCMGVYLIHGVVISSFKLVPWVTQHYFIWFVLTVFVSFMAVALMRRMPNLGKIV